MVVDDGGVSGGSGGENALSGGVSGDGVMYIRGFDDGGDTVCN